MQQNEINLMVNDLFDFHVFDYFIVNYLIDLNILADKYHQNHCYLILIFHLLLLFEQVVNMYSLLK